MGEDGGRFYGAGGIIRRHVDTDQAAQMLMEGDVAFAGHTHGFQFGVEIGNFKWSPSQYVYKQWAGLYQEGAQYLYVNRGFGYLGYPGRVGMPPELTIIQLKRGS